MSQTNSKGKTKLSENSILMNLSSASLSRKTRSKEFKEHLARHISLNKLTNQQPHNHHHLHKAKPAKQFQPDNARDRTLIGSRDPLIPRSNQGTVHGVTEVNTPKKRQAVGTDSMGRVLNHMNYEITWQVGADSDIGILNLCNSVRNDICFVSHEMVILMDIWTRQYKILKGHGDAVYSMKTDQQGQHLVTGSQGNIIVWDSYLGAPLLVLTPEDPLSPLLCCTISSSFHFVFAMTSQQLYVWNTRLLKRGIQANFVYELSHPVGPEIVEFLVDPECDNFLCAIAENEIYLYTIEEARNVEEQALCEYLATGKGKTRRKYTCGAYLPGTSKLLVGTQDGYITTWAGSQLIRHARVHIGATNKKTFIREIKLPRAKEINTTEVSVTDIKCTSELVIAGDSQGEITIMDINITIIYWVKNFGVSVVKGLSIAQSGDKVNDLEMVCEKSGEDSVTRNIREDLGEEMGRFGFGQGDSELLPEWKSTNSIRQSTDSVGQSKDSYAKWTESVGQQRDSPGKPKMHKLKLQTFMEDVPTEIAVERKVLKVNNLIVMGNQGEIVHIDFFEGTYSIIVEPKLTGIKHVTLHPKDSLAYILYEENTLAVVDYKAHSINHRKVIKTSQDTDPSDQEEVVCKVLNEKPAKDKEPNLSMTYVLCVFKFGISLLLCGFQNGLLWVLDRYLNSQYHPDTAAVSSAVTMISSNEANTIVGVAYKSGAISLHDLRTPVRLDFIAVYQAHTHVTHMIIDKSTQAQSNIVSIGTDRMIHVRTVTKILSNTDKKGVHTDKKAINGSNVKSDNKGAHGNGGNTDTLNNKTNADNDAKAFGNEEIFGNNRIENKIDTKATEKTLGNAVEYIKYKVDNVRIRRVEQFAQPLFISSLSREYVVKDILKVDFEPIEEDSVFLIGTSDFKYRLLYKSSLSCIKTIQEPTLHTPVTSFKVIPSLNAALFTSRAEMGVQKFPLSPILNDYIYLSLPLSTRDVFFTSDDEHVLSVGKSGELLRVWKIDSSGIRTQSCEFRHELEPYYCLISGGREGENFTKIEDTFLYFTIKAACQLYRTRQDCILHSEEIGVRTSIDVCDLPFILSGLGFFPTEFDLRMLTSEINLMELNELDFRHFLVLYLNHRPTRGVSYEEVLAAVDYFAHQNIEETQATENKDRSVHSSTLGLESVHSEHEVRESKSSRDTTPRLARPLSRKSSQSPSDDIPSSDNIRKLLQELSVTQLSFSNKKDQPKSMTKSSIRSSSYRLGSHSFEQVGGIVTSENIIEAVMKWGEAGWTREVAEEYVDFVFAGEDSLEVIELAARLIPPQTVIELDEVDCLRVYR